MPTVYLSSKTKFSAAHRLHSSELSEKENQEVFGKCNNPNGHGHNYELVVVLRGEVNSKTGMLMNIVDLDKIVREKIFNVVDHKNLNLDVNWFENINPTAENIAVVFWKELARSIDHNLLYEVTVIETPTNSASYRGE